MIEGFHHFAVISSSEESIAFYEKLGFNVFLRKERPNDTVVLLNGHGIQIEVFVDAKHAPRSKPEPLGLRHIALKVDNIEKTIQELGLELGSVKNDWIGNRYTFIADPDENALELHE